MHVTTFVVLFFFYYKSSTDEQCKQIFKYLRSDNELRKQQGQSAHKELHDSSQVASYLHIISIDVIWPYYTWYSWQSDPIVVN